MQRLPGQLDFAGCQHRKRGLSVPSRVHWSKCRTVLAVRGRQVQAGRWLGTVHGVPGRLDFTNWQHRIFGLSVPSWLHRTKRRAAMLAVRGRQVPDGQ